MRDLAVSFYFCKVQFFENEFKKFFVEDIQVPSQVIECVELVLEGNKLVEQKRLPGENDVGMVAWKMTLNTPEYPKGNFEINI